MYFSFFGLKWTRRDKTPFQMACIWSFWGGGRCWKSDP